MTIAAASLAPILTPNDLFAQGAPVQASILWIKRGSDQARVDVMTESGYAVAARLMRDVKANQIGRPSPSLLLLIAWMQAWLAAYGHHVCFNIHSGLRTIRTNNNIEGAARSSLHLPDKFGRFRALDFSAAPIPSEYLGRLAAMAQQGGVGFYSARNFTHVDDGRQRYWRSK